MPIETQRAMFEAAASAPPPYPAERFTGRGVVLCAGGARLFTCAYVCIGILRRVLGCRLPIQLWHLGPQEIGPPMRALLESFDVEVVDALAPGERSPLRIVGGWELKPYAIVHSRFREVVFIDVDNVALIDPARLFDLPQYAATGAVFWPDVVRLRADNPIWEICGVSYRSAPSFESGQLLVDKQRCWAALQLALHMNQHSDFFYQHLYGDKDTFLMSWLRLGQPFAMTSHAPFYQNKVIYQRDFLGCVIFQHRTGIKWSYGAGNAYVSGFELESECMALLEELQGVWNGRVFNPPDATPLARAAEKSLVQETWFDLLKIGQGENRLELLEDNRIGEGRGENEFYWWISEDAEGLVLSFEGRRRTGLRLRPMGDGSWRGRSLEFEGWEVQLAPASSAPSLMDAPAESVAALLDEILESVAEGPRDREALRDLTGALRVLSLALPGFAAALRSRLSSLADQDCLASCIRAVLLERTAVAAPQPARVAGAGPQFPNLGTHYEKSR